MERDTFSELLAKIPSIAKAVNAFTSENVQASAFQALLDAFHERHEVETKGAKDKGVSSGVGTKSIKRKKKKKKTQTKAKRPSIARDLNLHPKGEKQFSEFFNEKKPNVGDQTYTVCVYYLEKFLKIKGINQDHIYTCMKAVDRKPPKNLENTLVIAASRYGNIDTSDLSNITITVPGENLVDHDLPKKAKGRDK